MSAVVDRGRQLRLAHEAMLAGMLVNRAILPQVVLRTGGFDAMNDVAIDLWMGASPVYTHRMRALMGIEGDDVAAIMKALQLDVGFVHQYMDVVYVVHDEHHGEFWLNHCGALLDAEPFGEERVFGMCHTIEDPTFDATALATNPRARIRPIHRPPRRPADRHPHCHWTITIDPANEPVGPARLTQEVSELPLARVPHVRVDEAEPDGRTDYRGAFDPEFRLAALSTGTLRAVAEEFAVQAHLLAASGELALALRFGPEDARQMMASGWVGVSWTTSRRLAGALDLDASSGAAGIATVLDHQPLLPPGFRRDIRVEGNAAVLRLSTGIDGLLHPGHPGIPGLLARGERRGLEAMVQAIDARARLADLSVEEASVTAEFVLDPRAEPATEPGEAALMQSLASSWVFTVDR
jgi:hypothetical protein